MEDIDFSKINLHALHSILTNIKEHFDTSSGADEFENQKFTFICNLLDEIDISLCADAASLIVRFWGIDSQACSNGTSPLLIACNRNATDAACVLLASGADAATDSFGNTALSIAVANNNDRLTELLLVHGATKVIDKPDPVSGMTPLSFCIANALHKMVRRLLEYGADTFNIDCNYARPIDYVKDLPDEDRLIMTKLLAQYAKQ